MPIVASRSGDIQGLIVQLDDARSARRDSAVARLTLLGERVLEALLASLPTATVTARLGALSVLGNLENPRALPAVLRLIDDPDARVACLAADVAAGLPDPRAVGPLSRALGSSRTSLRRAAASALVALHAKGVVEALAPLLERLFDEREEASLRGLALDAVSLLPPRERRAILERLGVPSNRELARRIGPLRDGLRPAREAKNADPTPEGPAAIPRLRRLIDELGDRVAEGEPPGPIAEKKARAHLALASLGSRIAVYDLREMLEARPCLAAATLLQAAKLLADPALLPGVVGLAAESPAHFDACAEVFATVVTREKLRRSSRALKPVKSRHQPALERLWRRLRPA